MAFTSAFISSSEKNFGSREPLSLLESKYNPREPKLEKGGSWNHNYIIYVTTNADQ